jgi:hypothetical protein
MRLAPRPARTLAPALAPTLAMMLALSLAGCASPPKDYDYQAYLDHMPRSILVLPPLDETLEIDATCGCLAALTQPLAERGYYVFPVAVVDQMMKENGLPTPGEMHQVSLKKIDEIFGADSVLYVKVTAWGTSYRVLDSATTVTIEGRLVDVKSGVELWSGSRSAELHSNGGGGGLVGMLAGALLNQIASAAYDPSRDLANQADTSLIWDRHVGMLPGYYDPKRDEEMKARGLSMTK